MTRDERERLQDEALDRYGPSALAMVLALIVAAACLATCHLLGGF
jgi:hypothetical protein